MVTSIPYPTSAYRFTFVRTGAIRTSDEDVRIILWLLAQSEGDICEVGTCEGELAYHIAKQFPDRQLISLDWPVISETMDRLQQNEVLPRARIGHLSRHLPNVRLVLGDSRVFVPPSSIGAVFIDGDHSFEGVRADTELWLPYFEKRGRGLLIWHDYATGWMGVRQYLDSLPLNINHIGTVAYYELKGGQR